MSWPCNCRYPTCPNCSNQCHIPSDLVIDRPYQIRSKYVDEKFHRWFVFGERKLPEGVDVNDGECDVFVNISREAAEEFIRAKDQFVDELERLFNKYPGTYNKISPDYVRYR